MINKLFVISIYNTQEFKECENNMCIVYSVLGTRMTLFSTAKIKSLKTLYISIICISIIDINL